jgi:hypothetical protein
MSQQMDLCKSNSETEKKSPSPALLMPIPAGGTVPTCPSAVWSIGTANFTISRMRQQPVKKQVPVTQWIKRFWNQPIKNSKEKYEDATKTISVDGD